jgi:hypothetical protein
MKTLITAHEAVRFAPCKGDYPTAYICDHILNVEISFFRKCLGLELYEKLKADLVRYTDIQLYSSTAVYNLNDLAVLDSCIFKSLKNNNTASLSDEAAWSVAPKFKTPCYEELWTLFLRRYLAYMLLYTSITYSTNQASAKGLVRFHNDDTGISSADKNTQMSYKNSLLHDALITYENMQYFMQDNSCFEQKPCEKKCVVRRKTRIAYR